jgi:hypothetical protein
MVSCQLQPGASGGRRVSLQLNSYPREQPPDSVTLCLPPGICWPSPYSAAWRSPAAMTDSAVNIELVSTEPRPSLVREAAGVYAAAFAQAPYRETAQQAAAFEQRLARYARERDGFRFVTARGGDGQLAGMRSPGQVTGGEIR